ncbi:hypothetical protein Bbelb_152710 [Branchiostoma belcheri]|nr:hypothetical protein Bbelb_152710 [Branchiostoma belcheri]
MKINGRSQGNPVKVFLQDPWKHRNRSQTFFPHVNITWDGTRNPMTFDMGWPAERADEEEEARKYISKLDEDFTLVMILEHLDESVVLLKRLMCWELRDVLYSNKNKNSRPYRYKKYLGTPEELENHRAWSAVDYMLYNTFNNSLWRRIKEQGPDFYDELKHFRRIKDDVSNFCSGTNKRHKKARLAMVVPASKWNPEFEVDKEYCHYITRTRTMSLDQKIRGRRYTKKEMSYTVIDQIINYRLLAKGFPTFNNKHDANAAEENEYVHMPEEKYEALFHHFVYNKTWLLSKFPPETQYISILRRPFSNLKSQMNYYHLRGVLGIKRTKNPVRIFLQDPWQYRDRSQTFFPHANITWDGTRNPMTFDMGWPAERADEVEEARKYISELDEDFTLVMILEHLDESIVLLRRLMCWGVRDVLLYSSRKNSRGYPYKTYMATPKELENHRAWSAVDYMLYNTFNNSLWRKIKEQERPRNGQGTAKERPRNGQRTAKERPRSGQGAAKERPRKRPRNGQGTAKERPRNGLGNGQGTAKERPRNGLGTAKERPRNGQGTA